MRLLDGKMLFLSTLTITLLCSTLLSFMTYLKTKQWYTQHLKILHGTQRKYYMMVGFVIPLVTVLMANLCLPLLFQGKGLHQRTLIFFIIVGLIAAAEIFSYFLIRPNFPARQFLENLVKKLLIVCTSVTVFITLDIVFSIVLESIHFFSKVPFYEFIFGTHWSPHSSADPEVMRGSFGTVPLFLGSLIITTIALFVAGPIGLFSAIYTAFYAPPNIRRTVKPILEMLAGIPTVVYGFFAIVMVAPLISKLGALLGLYVATESALVAGLVMGVMIIPLISSLSDDVLYSLPATLREGSLGLGATYAETIRRVLLPAAFPGVVSSFLLAISRAIGETMLVVMAAGMSANLTLNPLEPVTTVTVQIVAILTGDQEFNSPKTLSAFALGLCLFIMTFALNYVAFRVVRRYRKQYETL